MDIAKHQQLYRRIKTAVAETTPQLIGNLNQKLEAYSGDARILDHFLTLFGNDNPYLAAQQAHLRQAIFRTPQELRQEKEVLGISVSGHKLTEQIFVLTHSYNPTRTWRSGSQAIVKIMEAFGSEEQLVRYTLEGQEKIKEKKKQGVKKSLENLVETLEELLADYSRVKDVQSRNDRLKVHTLLGLDEELQKRILMLDRVDYGNIAFAKPTEKAFLAAADPGGMFFGWYKKQLLQLPTAIRDIYTTITGPVEIAEEERTFMVGALIAYAATKMPINREAALGGYQKDLDVILGLPETHPIVAKYGIPNLASVRGILNATEITLIDITKVFDAYPVDQVRKEINRHYAAQFAAELGRVEQHLAPLFIQQGTWRDDAYGSSIPVSRLKKSIYFATLTSKDLTSVRDYLALHTIAVKKEAVFQALSLSDFKQLIDEVTLCGRKIEYLGQELAQRKKTVSNPEDAQEAADELKSVMPRGQGYGLQENFVKEHRISVQECSTRLDALYGRNQLWMKRSPQWNKLASFGLYSSSLVKELEEMVEMVQNAAPSAEWEERVKQSYAIAQSPFIRARSSHLPYPEKKYLTSLEQKAVQELLEVEPRLRELEQSNPTFATVDLPLRNTLREALFYSGKVEQSVQVDGKRYPLQAEPAFAVSGTLSLYDAAGIHGFCSSLLEGYTKASEVPASWYEKASFVVSFIAASALRAVGMMTAEYNSYAALRYMDKKKSYIANDFMEQVEELYGRVLPQRGRR